MREDPRVVIAYELHSLQARLIQMSLRMQRVTIALFLAIAGSSTASCADREAPAAPAVRSKGLASANPVRTRVFDSEPFVIDRDLEAGIQFERVFDRGRFIETRICLTGNNRDRQHSEN